MEISTDLLFKYLLNEKFSDPHDQKLALDYLKHACVANFVCFFILFNFYEKFPNTIF